MTKAPASPITIDVGARAEAKLEIKAQVPARSAGRLVDALTDIIRPFTEARGLKADQIRLQREEVAIKIAEMARDKLLIAKRKPKEIPLKVLVPLLEKSSLEDIDDNTMIDKWGNLLASAASGDSVQPRYISILGELSGLQVKFLDKTAMQYADHFENPANRYFESCYEGSLVTILSLLVGNLVVTK
jgi:hypothetical protein